MKNQIETVRSDAPKGRSLAHDKARDLIFRAVFGLLAAMSILGLGGCKLVGDIFKVGFWFGALLVFGLLAVSGGLVALLAKR